MNFFTIFPLVLAVILVFLVGWLLPKAGTTYDVFRLKAFIYAFVLFIPVLIIFGALKGSNLVLPAIFQEYIFVQFYLGIALLTALVYFNVSKYKLGKNENKV